MRHLALVTCLVELTAAVAAAQPLPEQAPTDFRFALVRWAGDFDSRASGWSRLAWELRRRTTIAVDLEVAPVELGSPALFEHPLLVWQGDTAIPSLAEEAVLRLRQHLTAGGTLLIDAADGLPDGPFLRSARRELARVLPDAPLGRVPAEHVIYKSFFLVDRHGGRVLAQPFLEGMFVEQRLAVILSANDLGGAMARDPFGQWLYDVGPGGEAVREMSFRLGINLVMYALCLDYKDDQVHIPFILRRRR